MEPLEYINISEGKDKTARKHIRAIEEYLNSLALSQRPHFATDAELNAIIDKQTEGIGDMEGFTVQTAKRDDTAHVLPPSDIPPKGTVKEKEPRSEEYVLVRDASEMGWASVRREFVDEFCEALRTTPIWPTES